MTLFFYFVFWIVGSSFFYKEDINQEVAVGRRTQQNIYRLDRDEEVLFPVLPDLGELDEWVEEDIQRLLEEP
ncbi:hypothetical protein CO172_01590, partial [Candidatus Uhrbacteria bacterium CG_4_9_14_3_um_filter_36_7]